MNLVPGALRNPHAVIVFMLMLVLFGWIGLTNIPIDLLPIFKTPAIQVVTLCPGPPRVVVEKDSRRSPRPASWKSRWCSTSRSRCAAR